MNALPDSRIAPWPVVVTRDEPGDGPLSRELRGLGLTVLSWPSVRVLPTADAAALNTALRQLSDYQWIVFTSRHAVTAVVEQLAAAPAGVRVAAVGDSTAQALREAGWTPHQVPEQHNAAGLVAALSSQVSAGSRVLYPASSRALPTLVAGLTQLGCEVTQVEAYQTLPAALDRAMCRDWVARRAIGAVTFTSPSAVEELNQALGNDCFEQLLCSSPAVSLGATTGRALAARGFSSVLASPATLSGLARAASALIQLRA